MVDQVGSSGYNLDDGIQAVMLTVPRLTEDAARKLIGHPFLGNVQTYLRKVSALDEIGPEQLEGLAAMCSTIKDADMKRFFLEIENKAERYLKPQDLRTEYDLQVQEMYKLGGPQDNAC